MKELRIIFMGTPDFAVATLKTLVENNFNIDNQHVVHGEKNPVQHPVAVINNVNFDIDNQHITHSVLLSGGESFSIIQEGDSIN